MESSQQEKLFAHIESLENKISELEDIIFNLPGNIYWLDNNNVYQGCNYAQAIAGNLASPRDIVGKTNRDMLWKSQAEELDAINAQVIATGVPCSVEEPANMLSGEGIYLSQKVPRRNRHGEIIGVLGVSIDITDRKRAEEALREAKEKAELANRLKTDFVRNMEHDIRTPLAGIVSVANYLRAVEKELSKQELLRDVENACNQLLEYIKNILNFSRMNSIGVPFIEKEFSIKKMIEGIIQMEQPAAHGKRLKLEANYDAAVPAMVCGDLFRLRCILINLVSNAIKFTENGHVNITINALTHEDANTDNMLLKFSVQDSGMGISKEKQEFIFDKFFRGDLANKGLYKGTGLGLWLVKQFVHDLGGEIKLESKLGKGTTFICVLPFTKCRASE